MCVYVFIGLRDKKLGVYIESSSYKFVSISSLLSFLFLQYITFMCPYESGEDTFGNWRPRKGSKRGSRGRSVDVRSGMHIFISWRNIRIVPSSLYLQTTRSTIRKNKINGSSFTFICSQQTIKTLFCASRT